MANNQQDWSSVTPAHWSLKTGPVITHENKSVYLVVAWLLAVIVIMSVSGIIWLAYLDKQIP